jgi:high-affinity K+ transport system ATPase subunit B
MIFFLFWLCHKKFSILNSLFVNMYNEYDMVEIMELMSASSLV